MKHQSLSQGVQDLLHPEANCNQQMKLIVALELLKCPVSNTAPDLTIFLACGFTPLHLETFLAAHLRILFPDHRIRVTTGLFGDLIGNITRLKPSSVNSLVVLIEWGDLDPRLAIRNLGGWRPANLHDIGDSASQTVVRLEEALLQASRFVPTVVCMPTLPFSPMVWTPPAQASACELQLRRTVASLAASLSQHANIRIVNAQVLDATSPPGGRFDVNSEVRTGFPYRLRHASALAEVLATLIQDRPPKKGLVTDLDDTLWAGILGEDGVNRISWDLDRQTHMHGLYQQFMASLAGAGTLIAVASKNDPAAVDRAFDRRDLLISRGEIFPFEIHWSCKSQSVQRILSIWNVSADSVVFVDDSPMEVAEVKAAFPGMECIVFPKGDNQAIWDLLKYLRSVFGKPFLTEDDSLRLRSIQSASAWRDAAQSCINPSDSFLKAAEASVVLDCGRQSGDVRAFELVNKTNQFNLNGKRFSESDWLNFFGDPAAFLLTVSYEDKYGLLGKIAVILGKATGRKVTVNVWAMSCRAFSRRIEHQCLNYLLEKFGPDEIIFDYEATPRNGPLQEFFKELLGAPPVPGVSLSKELITMKLPHLFHKVTEAVNV
jgi:FkbH-like protein